MTWVGLLELHVSGCSVLSVIPPTDSKSQRNCDFCILRSLSFLGMDQIIQRLFLLQYVLNMCSQSKANSGT